MNIVNQLPQNWRNYSPGGKRRKINRIPFGGKINEEFRAMGTKRIGIPKVSFMYMCDIANFSDDIEDEVKIEPTGLLDRKQVKILPEKSNGTSTNGDIEEVKETITKPNNNNNVKPFIFNRKLNLDDLLDSEKAQLTPEQFSVLYNKKKREEDLTNADEIRANTRQVRTGYRTFLASSAEARAWGKYLSGR